MNNRYLETLELSPGASKKDIKTAYRRLSKKYHPDLNASPDAHDKFVALVEAYNFLSKVGPSPGKQQKAYDYDPFDSAFEKQRSAAKARARQKARDLARMQEQTIKKVLFIFKQASLVIVVFNVLLAVDFVLPRKKHQQQIQYIKPIYEQSVKQNGRYVQDTNHTYEDVYFEDYVMRFRKDEVIPLEAEEQAVVLATRIFGKPMQAIFMADGQAVNRNQLLGIFKVFGALIPAILMMALFYHVIVESLDTKLSLAVVMVVFFFIQLFIYIRF